MARVTYNDIFSGTEDERISEITGNHSSDEQRQKIQKILMEIIENELSPKQRTAIKEYFFNHRSMPEIAEQQGVSVSAVSAMIRRGKKRIKEFLKYCLTCRWSEE